jgi:polyvinyl alcohol dehydrogenase (cytochrome)
VLSSLTIERILSVISVGTMKAQAAGLSGSDRTTLARFLSSTHGSPDAAASLPAAGQCAGPSSFTIPDGDRAWNGWGADLLNSRFRSGEIAGLTPADLPRLKLKWAFGFANDLHAYAQPSVVGGRVFVGSESGIVYALDASTGCTRWTFKADGPVRTATSVGVMPRPALVSGDSASTWTFVFFGDQNGYVYAVDADSGVLRWKVRADAHEVAIVTGAPKFHDGRLYVPVSSGEEGAAASPKYECCTFRGSVVAFDALTGQKAWQTFLVDAPKPTGTTKTGIRTLGPSGVAVWSSPIVDVARNALYVATGDNYSWPDSPMSDGAVAIDLATGAILWHNQLTSRDVWTVACAADDKSNCPDDAGPDFDFGATPVLASVPGTTKRVILMGQKSSVAYALDPDNGGALVWKKQLGRGGLLGGIQWGFSADHDAVYFPLSDVVVIEEPGKPSHFDRNAGGGLFALDLGTGNERWHAAPAACGMHPQCSPAQSAATTVIPGVVFSGAMDGVMRAYSTTDGKVIWTIDTVQDYQTVNGVAAKGGAIDGPGPVVAGGMLFVTSGYARMGGLPGNVLLAFTVDGQ